MINLSTITLVAMTSVKLPQTIKALEYSCREIKFGAVKLITDKIDCVVPDYITIEHCSIMSNIEQWNYQIIYNLGDYIDTEFALLIHDDGFVINPESWRDEFLNYDYIGAPWSYSPAHFSDIYGNVIRVGNSVSIRSRRLLILPKQINMPFIPVGEDVFVCVYNRHVYTEHGMKFANIDIAKYFSHESYIPELEGITPFAFHGNKGFFD